MSTTPRTSQIHCMNGWIALENLRQRNADLVCDVIPAHTLPERANSYIFETVWGAHMPRAHRSIRHAMQEISLCGCRLRVEHTIETKDLECRKLHLSTSASNLQLSKPIRLSTPRHLRRRPDAAHAQICIGMSVAY
eukprot:6195216-Pleurochrysis_carterae.AAC.2